MKVGSISPSNPGFSLSLILLLGAVIVLVCSIVETRSSNTPSVLITVAARPETPENWRLYNPDPNHIWNRLYRSLYRRVSAEGKEYGYDELDPLLWYSTKYLLSQPANAQALADLDEFLSTHAEKAITDPLQRAIMQRDLWAIFDWTTEISGNAPEKLKLQQKLALAIRRLALSPEQISRLPNTYQQTIAAKTFASFYQVTRPEQPFLPLELLQRQGPWVLLSARGGGLVAPLHAETFSDRSVFRIFIHLPGDREATLDYLKNLSLFPRPWIFDPATHRARPNPDLPEFPVGTQLAMVRTMLLIDSTGKLAPTNVIEDIQVRVHHTIPRDVAEALNDTSRVEAGRSMSVFEFKFSRVRLFAGSASGSLRALAKGDTEFPLFMSHGVDVFEEPSSGGPLERSLRVSLDFCASCHFRPGVHSMLSRSRTLVPLFPEATDLLPAWDPNYEINETMGQKMRQYNWGLLEGLWRSQ
ncbi:MAG TPA: hypothetical protein VKB46_21505 [Pyrinomonadaceae bacterium]|nr:hypothetical protein [Pyrinomonadaceae bacterium]